MGSDRGRFIVAAIAALTCAIPGRAECQGPDSARSYDQSALRVERGFWRERLVRGSRGEKVAGLGFFPPTIPILAQSGDSVRRYYESFRSRSKTGNWLTLVGFALVVTSVFVVSDNTGAGAALFIAGLGVEMGGIAVVQKGRDDLNRAVWWYNREFH